LGEWLIWSLVGWWVVGWKRGYELQPHTNPGCHNCPPTPSNTLPPNPPPPQAVLYGIFGAVLLGAALSALRLWWVRRPLAALRAAQHDPEAQRNLKNVVRFRDTAQVSHWVGGTGVD
jgi:hypothetical protein